MLKLKSKLLFLLVLVLLSTSFASAKVLIPVETGMHPSKRVIREEAFCGMKALDQIVVPEGTTAIMNRAFAESSLKEIDLPASLTYIAEDAFSGCGDIQANAPQGSYAWNWCVRHGLIKTDEFALYVNFDDDRKYHVGETATWTATVENAVPPYDSIFELYYGETKVMKKLRQEGQNLIYTFEQPGFYSINASAKDFSGASAVYKSKKIYVLPKKYAKRDDWDGRNLLEPLTGTRNHNGIVFKAENGSYTVNGTARKTAYAQLAGGASSVPEWAYEFAGETLDVQYSTESLLQLIIRVYPEGNPDGYVLLNTRRGTRFVMPDMDNIEGFSVRLQVPTGYTIDDVKVKPVISWNSRKKNPPMLTIIDDDGDIKYYEQLYPLAKSKGVSVATAVTPTRIESGLKRWMSWEQIQEVHANGMEVLCHTYSHPKPADLAGVSQKEITRRYQLAKDIMIGKGVYSADFIVYSSSTGNLEKVQNAAKQVFSGGVLVGYDSINFSNADPYALTRYRIDYTYNYNVEAMKVLIDELKESGGWMIWMIHTSDSGWDESRLNAIGAAIDHAKEVGVPIVTAAEGMSRYSGK